jgi:hypothetical protein
MAGTRLLTTGGFSTSRSPVTLPWSGLGHARYLSRLGQLRLLAHELAV